MKLRPLVIAAATLALGACATAPKPLQGQYSPLTPQQSVASAQTGATVRWGGNIVKTVPGPDSTCFQMLGRPLGASGRPSSSGDGDASNGRFVACRAGFYDPAIFEAGREVTFIGHIDGYETTKIGDYDYKLPKLAADIVYLWPVVQQNTRTYPYPYDPFWGPGPYWGGPYWGPRWGWW